MDKKAKFNLYDLIDNHKKKKLYRPTESGIDADAAGVLHVCYAMDKKYEQMPNGNDMIHTITLHPWFPEDDLKYLLEILQRNGMTGRVVTKSMNGRIQRKLKNYAVNGNYVVGLSDADKLRFIRRMHAKKRRMIPGGWLDLESTVSASLSAQEYDRNEFCRCLLKAAAAKER